MLDLLMDSNTKSISAVEEAERIVKGMCQETGGTRIEGTALTLAGFGTEQTIGTIESVESLLAQMDMLHYQKMHCARALAADTTATSP